MTRVSTTSGREKILPKQKLEGVEVRDGEGCVMPVDPRVRMRRFLGFLVSNTVLGAVKNAVDGQDDTPNRIHRRDFQRVSQSNNSCDGMRALEEGRDGSE